MLVYLRHGATSLNKGGKEERLRGWLPVPLSPLGVQQAHDAAARLRQVLPGPPNTMQASDLHRTQQTADIVSKALGMPVQSTSSLRDWNTGDMAGQKVTDVLPMMKYYIAHPDEAPPNGEPLNEYRQRFEPEMRKAVTSPGVHVRIGHARGATIVEGIADPVGGQGGELNPKFLFERPRVDPGGILLVNNKWQTKIDNLAAKDSEPADG